MPPSGAIVGRACDASRLDPADRSAFCSSAQPPPQSLTIVARPLPPHSTASIDAGSPIENTMIGIRFSRASAKAVASITL